jgi:hypothetical protein
MRKVAFGILAVAMGATGAAAYAADDDEPIYHNEPKSAFLRDRNISVLERPRPEYASAGVPMGGMTVLPRITIGEVYDTNIFAQSSHAKSDLITQVQPEVRVVSNWSRNDLEAFAHASLNGFAAHRRENTTDYAAGAKGRYDVVGLSYIFAEGGYGLYTIPRTSGSSPLGAAHPEQYYQAAAAAGAVEELNRVRFTERADISSYRYLNVASATGQGSCPEPMGAVICSYGENHKTYTASGKAEYAISPAIALFVAGAANTRQYDYAPALVGIDRDSNGWELTGGGSFDIRHLARGEIQLGYLDQTYRNHQPAGGPSNFPSVKGLAVHGKVDWFPTERTTVSFNADRAIQDWTIPLSSGTLATTGGVRIDYELLRNVILSANGGYNQFQYQGVGRTDDIWKAGAAVNYLLNRGVGVGVSYGLLSQQAHGGGVLSQGANFSDNRLMASLTLQY